MLTLTADEGKQIGRAISAMLRRLSDLGVQWPAEALRCLLRSLQLFRRALQTAITTSRTVTFIVQSNKSVIPDFDAWYRDSGPLGGTKIPLCSGRNSLATRSKSRVIFSLLSQLRVTLIGATTYRGLVSQCIPENILASLGDIRRSIPAKLMDDHLIEHGSLVVERRWVDVELPDFEVLDALSLVSPAIRLDADRPAPPSWRTDSRQEEQVGGPTSCSNIVHEDGRPEEMSLLRRDNQITISR